MDGENTEPKQLSSFEKYDEFMGYLQTIMDVDLFSDAPSSQAEDDAFRRLPLICDEYQEQSFLLDPLLDKIIVPPMEALRLYTAKVVTENRKELVSRRFSRLCAVIYQVVKTRGYKTIVPFFPHQVSDLETVVTFMERYGTHSGSTANSWAVPYLMLLWLSLICRLPFDLASFDDAGSTAGLTAQKIEQIGQANLNKAGIGRDSAAFLLSRFYTRSDTQVLFGPFLSWCEPHLAESSDLFLALGSLQTMSEILKSGGMDQIGPHLTQIFELGQKAAQNDKLSAHTSVRKQAIKVSGRVGLALLPPTPRTRKTVRTLLGKIASQNEGFAVEAPEVADIPAEVEGVVDDMLTALRDRDTTIRWSAAKYIARIASRVPDEFCDQLLDAVVDLYTLHYVEGEDLSPTTEPSWHGATLACAEFARQGLVSAAKVPIVVHWVLKALFFDVRKGAHSIGSSVRDAACYFVWSLARSQDAEAIKPHAEKLARSLMTLALFDREVHIRRAASASFQENVGRMGLFPHGIDVLKWTDFYGVGVRRNSFLVAAPEVSKYLAYRDTLLQHLVQTTLRHWDADMREIGSQALRIICQPDLDLLAPGVINQLKQSLAFVDNHEIHGAVLGLREMAEAFKHGNQPKQCVQIFELIDQLRESTLKGYGNDILLEASCFLISSSISQEALVLRPDIRVKVIPRWRFILDISLRHRNDKVQEAAARTVGVLTHLRSKLKTTNPVVQQGLTKVLGYIATKEYPQGVRKAIECLMGVARRTPGKQITYCVEARRNSNDSIAHLLSTVGPVLADVIDPEFFQQVLRSLVDGLDDYTVDERGDVGSWVRISSIKALGDITHLIICSLLRDWLPLDLYFQIWAGLLKQGAERLDNVRAEVERQLLRLLRLVESTNHGAHWVPHGYELMKKLFITEVEDGDGWNESTWLFPHIVQLLQIPEYRSYLLKGIVLSIGSRNESTHRPAATALTEYLLEREAASPEEHIIDIVFRELLEIARSNSTSNTIVLPILATFDFLIEGGLVAEASDSQERRDILISLVNFVGQRIDKVRNVQRINASMKILVQLLAVPEASSDARKFLPSFLGHAFPKIREETGEFLYLVIQAQDIPGGDAAEQTLLETNWSGEDYRSHVSEVVSALEAEG